MVSSEAKGTRVVFGFGDHKIGHVLFLGLHGFDVKKHAQGWWFFFLVLVVIIVAFLITVLIGPQGLKTHGSASFGEGTLSTSAFAFAFFFLLLDFLRGKSSLNVAVGLGIHILVTGRTIHVPTAMTSNVFQTHFQFETVLTSVSS